MTDIFHIQCVVPADLSQQLLALPGKIFAKTDFNNPYSPTAYKLLSQRAHLPNFFFGILVPSFPNDEIRIEALTHSNSANDTLLDLQIPRNHLFFHYYYDFSNLINDCRPYDQNPQQIVDPAIKQQANALGSNITTDSKYVQVIFDRIDPNWVTNVSNFKKALP